MCLWSFWGDHIGEEEGVPRYTSVACRGSCVQRCGAAMRTIPGGLGRRRGGSYRFLFGLWAKRLLLRGALPLLSVLPWEALVRLTCLETNGILWARTLEGDSVPEGVAASPKGPWASEETSVRAVEGSSAGTSRAAGAWGLTLEGASLRLDEEMVFTGGRGVWGVKQ